MKQLEKGSKFGILAFIIVVASHGIEKILELLVPRQEGTGICLAMVYTLLTLTVIMLLFKCDNPFFGLLAGLTAFKMMPVAVSFLGKVSPDAEILYYVVKQAALFIFMGLIFRLYKLQDKPREVQALPVLTLMFAVPMFTNIGLRFTSYFADQTGSMLYGFFAQYACYIAATLVILAIGWFSGYTSLRFTVYFECAALGINILRYVGRIAANMLYAHHISKSWYGWLAVYVGLLALCLLAKEIRKRKEAVAA